MNHVSVSPTDGNGPTQGQRKTPTRVGIEPTTFGSLSNVMKQTIVIMHDVKTTSKLHYLFFKNQSIYIRCHKSFGITLGRAHCFLRRLFLLLVYLVYRQSVIVRFKHKI